MKKTSDRLARVTDIIETLSVPLSLQNTCEESCMMRYWDFTAFQKAFSLIHLNKRESKDYNHFLATAVEVSNTKTNETIVMDRLTCFRHFRGRGILDG